MQNERKVVVGLLQPVIGPAGEGLRRAKVGAEPPDWIQLFADGEHVIDGETKNSPPESWLCDAEARVQIIAAFLTRGNDLVVDYEHQTLDGGIAPAAGFIVEMADRGEQGLWGRVEWTETAKAYLRSGEYRFHSCVYDVDTKTRRVTRVHHVAITNWPRTHNARALDAAVVAKARLRFGITAKATARFQGQDIEWDGRAWRSTAAGARYAKEGRMTLLEELKERITWWLNLSTATATNKQAREGLLKLAELFPADDQLLVTAKADATTLGGIVGVSATAADVAPAATEVAVAAKAVFAELELPENATLAQVQARVVELRSPVGTVTAAEHAKVQDQLKTATAKIAALELKTDEERVTQLIASNRSKIPPAREEWIRAKAKEFGYAHAADIVAHLRPELPSSAAAENGPGDSAVVDIVAGAATRKVSGRDVPVDAESLQIAAKVRAIQNEDPAKFGDYADATAEMRRRARVTK